MYRLEQESNRQGLKLSQQTMANWLLKASEKWLQSVYDALHKQLCKEPVLHADETTLQVLKEPGRSSTSKSYIWLYRTSGCAKQAIVLYEYQAHKESGARRAFPARLLGLAARGRIPGIPQIAWEHPCGGLLGACKAKI